MARVPLPSSVDFRGYGESVIRERLRKMLSYTDGVRSADDIEALHDMRVASRRTRAALAVFEAAFADPDFPAFCRDVRDVTRELGAARDLDVMIETLERLEGELPEAARPAFERLIDARRRARADLQAGVVRALNRMERRDLATWFDQIAARSRGEDVPRARRGGAARIEPVHDAPAPDAAQEDAP